MRWHEIYLLRGEWRIITKANNPQTVTLSPEAIAILIERKQMSNSEWVFPGIGKTGHLVEPKGAWKQILNSAGLSDIRIHDLRRTLGS